MGTVTLRRLGLAVVLIAATVAGVVAFRVSGANAGKVSALRARLSETGLYLADGSIDPGNRPFAPQYPLWTDGARKARWIRLPREAHIDVSDIDGWRFPPGTTLWKEFSWKGRKVETRMLRAEANGTWTFAAYVWNDEQTDATLAPPEGVAGVFEIAPGKWHSVPSQTDCAACHESGASVVLGFSALQLSDDRDPLAPHSEALPQGAVTLRSLIDEDRLRPRRRDLRVHPPRIREADPVARAAVGYINANCGTCHNSSGPLERLGFSLKHDVAGEPGAAEPALATTLGTAGRFLLPGDTARSSRLISPGSPDGSAILHRMKSRSAATQMPPLGTVVVDSAAVALIRRWISGLQ